MTQRHICVYTVITGEYGEVIQLHRYRATSRTALDPVGTRVPTYMVYGVIGAVEKYTNHKQCHWGA